jgi:hypothetical protein
MQGMQAKEGEKCPFTINFDPAAFKPGDLVSYRVETMDDFPFLGSLLEVHDDHVVISANDPSDPHRRMRGTRESRPKVTRVQALD